MSEHYFSQKPQSKSSPKTWNYELLGHSYTFTSDVGVFSKNTVDFGTQLLIEQFEKPSIPGDFLDLGCGYGPIGIVLASRHPERSIVLADINERAIELAETNIVANSVNNTRVVLSDRFAQLESATFAAIITNPPIRVGKKVMYKMFEECKAALTVQGELWIVIQRKQGAPSAKKELERLFGSVEVVAREKGYYIYRMIKG